MTSMDKANEREFYITRQCMKFFHPLYKVKIKTEILFKPLVDSYPFYPFLIYGDFMNNCIYDMTAEELIQNKDYCLTELTLAQNDLMKKENELLLNTDFKELKLTNEKMRTAYINEQCIAEKNRVNGYKNSLAIINDLLKLRLMEMNQE